MKWKKGDGSYVVFGGSTVFLLSLAQSGLHAHLKTSCCVYTTAELTFFYIKE